MYLATATTIKFGLHFTPTAALYEVGNLTSLLFTNVKVQQASLAHIVIYQSNAEVKDVHILCWRWAFSLNLSPPFVSQHDFLLMLSESEKVEHDLDFEKRTMYGNSHPSVPILTIFFFL